MFFEIINHRGHTHALLWLGLLVVIAMIEAQQDYEEHVQAQAVAIFRWATPSRYATTAP